MMTWFYKKISLQGKIFISTILIICIVSYCYINSQTLFHSDTLSITMLNVGQGDAFFIQSGNGNSILIDTGPDNSIASELGRVMKNTKTIDVVILTHPDADHIGGFEYLLDFYKINLVIISGITCETKLCDTVDTKIEQHDIPITFTQAGQSIILNTTLNIHLDILFPLKSLQGTTMSDKNAASVVGRLVYNESEVLFTGDAPKKIETALLSSNLQLESDILKVAHHGSDTSTSKEFLQAIQAQFALISAGEDNKYGHPHKSILNRLTHEYHMKIFRTDEHERVQLCTNGNGRWDDCH